jgi:LPXTG-motif cell wall-anchored protein
MDKINSRFLMIAFIIAVVLFFYFGAGAMIEGGLNGRMHANGLTGSISWRIYPATITLLLSAALGWLLFKKRNKSGKEIPNNLNGE